MGEPIITDLRPYHCHDDVIKWKHFPRYWPYVQGIHLSPVNFLHKGQWREALMFSLICAWINGWVNNRGAGDLRRHRAYYDVIVMALFLLVAARLADVVCCSGWQRITPVMVLILIFLTYCAEKKLSPIFLNVILCCKHVSNRITPEAYILAYKQITKN